MGRLFHIYCDESCTEPSHQYMVFGGIMIPREKAEELSISVKKWRTRANMTAELKWKKVTSNKYQHYREYVDGVLNRVKKQEMAFRSVVLRHSDMDCRRFHGGNQELQFYKFMFQFLYNSFVRFLYEGDKVVIFVDERTTDYSLDDLKRVLNRRACRHKGWTDGPFRSVQPVVSHDSELMQMNDVLMGAVAHQNNRGEDVPGRRQSKVDLAQHIAKAAGLSNLRVQTPVSMSHFGIWQFKLQKKTP